MSAQELQPIEEDQDAEDQPTEEETPAASIMPLPQLTGDELTLIQIARALAHSGYFRDRNLNLTAAQALSKILAGRELGLPPVASMVGIYIVRGRVSLSANVIAALIKRSGRYDYQVERLDAEQCQISFRQRLSRSNEWKEIGVSEFTIEDARVAGLLDRTGERGPSAWQAHPRNMLFARALSNGAKWYTPDVFAGPIYTPDEILEREETESPGSPRNRTEE